MSSQSVRSANVFCNIVIQILPPRNKFTEFDVRGSEYQLIHFISADSYQFVGPRDNNFNIVAQLKSPLVSSNTIANLVFQFVCNLCQKYFSFVLVKPKYIVYTHYAYILTCFFLLFFPLLSLVTNDSICLLFS